MAKKITEGQNYYWIFYKIFSRISFWLCMLLSLVASIIPDVCIKVIENLNAERNKTKKNISRLSFKPKIDDEFELED